jgi:hypothetical protein
MTLIPDYDFPTELHDEDVFTKEECEEYYPEDDEDQ